MRTLTVLSLLTAASTAQATTYTVTTTADVVADDGVCSLREAVDSANGSFRPDCGAVGSGDIEVDLPAGTFVLGGASGDNRNVGGDLDLTVPVTFVGAGQGETVISASGTERVFDCILTAAVSVRSLALRDGNGQGALVRCGGQSVSLTEVSLTESTGTSIVEGNTLSLDRVTLANTSSTQYGLVGNVVTITGSTLVGNTAPSDLVSAQSLSLSNSTIINNAAGTLFGISASGRVVYATIVDNRANMTRQASLLVDRSIVTSRTSCTVPLRSAGTNVADTSGCITSAVSDVHAADLRLAPIDYYGGGTLTRKPLPDSPVLDLVSCDEPSGIVVDQRGVHRPQGVRCDVGAVELGVTLRQAVQEPPGANCAAGGVAVATGEDQDGDGTLSASEILGATYTCNTASTLVAVTAEPAGPNCAAGGSRIDSGFDENADGTLGASEVLTTTYVCSASAQLVVVTAEPAGANCAAGGTRIYSGVDTNGDGALDPTEIEVTAFTCRDTGALVAVTAEAAGDHCEAGGQRVDSGRDTNGDGVLAPEEVTSTEYVCTDELERAGCDAGGGTSPSALLVVAAIGLARRRRRRTS